jgi:uncharacterized protein (UPF0210 family)
MQENILMLLKLDEIRNITKGLKVALKAIDKDEDRIDENLKENIEDVLIKLLNAEYECSKNID